MVEADLIAEQTLAWLREKSQVELVPEGSLAEKEAVVEETVTEAEFDSDAEVAED
jgi:trigger factor